MKQLFTIFQSFVGGGWGALWDKLAHRGSEMATLCEFDENDRFFTTFCDPYNCHTFKLFYKSHPKKDTKNGF
jgi:hypothetical protein